MKRLNKPSKFNRSNLLKRLGGGGAAALMLSITACGSVPQNTSQSPEAGSSPSAATTAGASVEGQLKIGTLLPITGDLAQYGTTMQDSVNLLGETVNACGGVLGKPVQIVSEDDQTDPAAGAAGMTKLAEVDKVAGVVGAAGSAVSSAAVDIAVRNQVVQISPSSTSPTFTDRAKKGEFNGFWFRTAPPDTFQGDALAQLAQQQGAKEVAVLAINNDYGNGLIDSFIPAFKELGGTVTNESSPTKYAPDATTFDSELRAAFNGNPDAIVMVAYPETGSIILKQAQEQGLLDGNTKILMSDGMKTDKLAELSGKTADDKFIVSGGLGTAPSAGGPAIDQFSDAYQNKFNRAPNVYDPNSWDAAAVIALAAEAAKATTGAAIKDQIRAVTSGDGEKVTDVCQGLALLREGKPINYEGASGTVDFNPEGDVVGSYDVWTIADDGKLQVQSKIEVAGSDS
ncbi:ABC transporter substrate-binding protein [Leptolyngbya sp. FACHB-711]|uniref:ABC transporter substrate-binding protein n=1 Tax=unclassified Leptolyngbya TaxID=2650499 RepID=UPI001F54DFBF|nr:ABC transporter substrate-binding protein [Leptolyngbya sp. FACHB-711]